MSYHSLEDRRVKQLMKFGSPHGSSDSSSSSSSGGGGGSSGTNVYDNRLNQPLLPWIPLHNKAISPQDTEVESNPRSRSAKLRVAERSTPGE